MLADRIAILAVYLPTIRTEVAWFVDHWNTHNLRKQPNRSKAIQGKPLMLFQRPKNGIRNLDWAFMSQHTKLRRDVEDYGKKDSFEFVRN